MESLPLLEMSKDLNNLVRDAIEETLALSRQLNYMTCGKIEDSWLEINLNLFLFLPTQDEPVYYD